MTTHPVLITQDEKLDLTMENTDIEQMDKPVLTMATTTQHAMENLVAKESIPKKKLVQKDLHGFFKITDLHPKKKIITPRRQTRRRNRDLLKPPDTLLKNPKTIRP